MKGRVAAITITIAHGLVGWGLCGAAMGLAMAATTLENALIIHAVAAPAIFIAVSFVYFRRFGSSSPLRAAAQFLGVVVAMDFLVVALLVERSFKMFAIPL